MSLNKTYAIVDSKFHDKSSSANLSKYTANGNARITFDSTNEAYQITRLNSGAGGLSSITLNNHRFTNQSRIEADIMLINSTDNIQTGIGLLNNNIGVNCKITRASGVNVYAMSCLESTRTTYGSNEVSNELSSSDIVLNRWFHCVVEINESDIAFKLYYDDVLLGTINTSKSVLSSTDNELAFWIGFSYNSKALVKNITVL